MKKIVLLLFLIASLTACGSYKAKITTGVTPDFTVTANAYFDIEPINNTLASNTIQSMAWNIDRNTGGSGTIGFAVTTFGGSCTGIVPLETISITAGQVSVADTPFSPSTVSTINGVLNGLGSYRVCITVSPTSAPVNVHLRLPIIASEVIGG